MMKFKRTDKSNGDTTRIDEVQLRDRLSTAYDDVDAVVEQVKAGQEVQTAFAWYGIYENDCSRCNGRGNFDVHNPNYPSFGSRPVVSRKCQVCGGTGKQKGEGNGER